MKYCSRKIAHQIKMLTETPSLRVKENALLLKYLMHFVKEGFKKWQVDQGCSRFAFSFQFCKNRKTKERDVSQLQHIPRNLSRSSAVCVTAKGSAGVSWVSGADVLLSHRHACHRCMPTPGIRSSALSPTSVVFSFSSFGDRLPAGPVSSVCTIWRNAG